jgi:stage II sporulation protein AA (anti-sigma F factor antagonist)
MKEAKIFADGKEVRVAISCEIDHHSAKTVRAAADEAIERYRPTLLVLDFSEVRFMDSSGIGLILGRVMAAERVGAAVELRGLFGDILRIVRMSGIEKLKCLKIKEEV